MGVRFGGGGTFQCASVVREAKSQEIGYSALQNRRVHCCITCSPINNPHAHVGVLGLGISMATGVCTLYGIGVW